MRVLSPYFHRLLARKHRNLTHFMFLCPTPDTRAFILVQVKRGATPAMENWFKSKLLSHMEMIYGYLTFHFRFCFPQKE